MKTTKAERISNFYNRMYALGLTFPEIEILRRAQLTLHRWAEQECGDSNDYASWSIERDETTDKPYKCIHPHSGKSYRIAIPDREKGALRRVEAVIKGHPGLWFYHQTDPRGCALYVGNQQSIHSNPLDQSYTQGVAVCI